MNVSLEQAIEIYGKALKYRRGAKAGSAAALEQAERCRATGDDEGFEVWRRVSVFVLGDDPQTDGEPTIN